VPGETTRQITDDSIVAPLLTGQWHNFHYLYRWTLSVCSE